MTLSRFDIFRSVCGHAGHRQRLVYLEAEVQGTRWLPLLFVRARRRRSPPQLGLPLTRCGCFAVRAPSTAMGRHLQSACRDAHTTDGAA